MDLRLSKMCRNDVIWLAVNVTTMSYTCHVDVTLDRLLFEHALLQGY